MSSPFLSEIRMVSFNYAPRGWAFCNGQFMAIAQNQAVFALLGTTYGGNGQTTFQLPNLQGRAPMHFGSGPGLTPRNLGEVGGAESHTLIQSEMPAHTHAVGVVDRPGTQAIPTGSFLAARRGGYAESGNMAMNPGAVAVAGGSQPHNNMPPYHVLNFCIALQGIFPSRN